MTRLMAPFAVLVTVAMLFGSAAPTAACSCVPPPEGMSQQEFHVSRASIIVVGTIEDLIAFESSKVIDEKAVISVDRYLKGSGPDRIDIGHPGDTSCAFFRASMKGSRYVIFASSVGGLSTGSCSGNIGLGGPNDNSLAAIEAITGPGQEPTEKAPVSPTPEADNPVSSTDDPVRITDLQAGQTGTAQEEAEDDDLPRAAMWVGAIVLPLAFLAVSVAWASRKE